MSAEDISSIARSLDVLARVAVLRLIDGRERNDQLRLLDDMGFKHAEIGPMVGMNANAVRVALSRMKQQRGKAAD